MTVLDSSFRLRPAVTGPREIPAPAPLDFSGDPAIESECIRRHDESDCKRTLDARGVKIPWAWMTETYRQKARMAVSTEMSALSSVASTAERPVVWLWEVVQACALRSARWHAGGLTEWSRDQWGMAVTGEIGELAEVVEIFSARGMESDPGASRMIGNEAADVFIYIILFVERLRAETLDIEISRGVLRHTGRQPVEFAEISLTALAAGLHEPTDPVREMLLLTKAWGLLCNGLKKWRRHLDGMVNRSGPGVDISRVEDIQTLVEREIATVLVSIFNICRHFGVDFSAAVVATFNATSQKNNFPDRLPLIRDV